MLALNAVWKCTQLERGHGALGFIPHQAEHSLKGIRREKKWSRPSFRKKCPPWVHWDDCGGGAGRRTGTATLLNSLSPPTSIRHCKMKLGEWSTWAGEWGVWHIQGAACVREGAKHLPRKRRWLWSLTRPQWREIRFVQRMEARQEFQVRINVCRVLREM